MLEADERVGRLAETILDDARATAGQITADAEKKAAELLNQARELYRRDEQQQIEADRQKSHTRYAKEISTRVFSSHKQVLAHRNELVNGLFEKVRGRIEKYTKTAEYGELLIKLVEKADREIKIVGGCVVFVNKNDMKYAEEIKNHCPAEVKSDASIALGGVSVYYPDNNIYVDYTLDSALEKQRRDFVNHNELSL